MSIFSTKLLDEQEHEIKSDRLFDEMLSHLYLPLVNLNNYLKHVLDGGQRHAGKDQLESSVVQLKTKAEVLQFAFDRLISEMMLHKYTHPKAISTVEEDRRLTGV